MEAAEQAASEIGIKLKEIVWTQGQYDLVAIWETSDETAAGGFMFNLLKAGNVRTQTLRAFSAAEIKKMLERVV